MNAFSIDYATEADLDRRAQLDEFLPAERDWHSPDLTLLGTGRRPAPPFPVELFGPYWSAWVQRSAEHASAPVDYVGTALLTCVGAALGNVRWPVAGTSWSEPPHLWSALIGGPSYSKSPSIDATVDLLRDAEDRMAAGFDDDRRQHEAEKQAAEARREAWKQEVKNLVKAGGNPPRMPSNAEDPEPPVRPRIRVADATVEKLAALAAALPRGLLLQRDELSGWLGGFDRYGGAGSDRAFAIEMYGGRGYVVDRMKTPEPLRIRHLSIGVLGGVQPDKLAAVLDGPDDGLAARILWTWPDVQPGFSLARSVADHVGPRRAFARLTDLAMGSDEFGFPEPRRVRLSNPAEDALEAFAREIAARAADASGVYAGMLGKARGHALRLALVLEFMWWCGAAETAEPAVISERAVLAAAGLMDGYFIVMAERVCGDAAIPVAERQAMALARFLRKRGAPSFNARDVRRDIGGALRETAAMDAACATLVEAGLILPTAPTASTGRKPKNFLVNPAVLRRPS